ncbi:putative ABC-type transport system, periplasmic binding protein [Vibrio harveyi]|uniref:ABC transporter substrate-binding protein n=1 Tax=Vibrio harveyi TaxID=669 RepID=UPI002AD7950D|nr:ABC transporter substrate-binding protein [Vibrio harveyi]CAK6715924.1 putative ABC-type transport system, periplasmic binding protein [Vibrio harveyi]
MTETCLRRLSQLLNHYNHSQLHQVSLDELETVFATSRRNTSNVIKMLHDYGWINWTPGRGRGKANTLKVMISMHQALYRTIHHEISTGNFDAIPKYLEIYKTVAASALSQAMTEVAQENQNANSLIISQYPWVNELNPSVTYRFSELQVIRSIYDTLFTIDSNGQLNPHLACDYKTEGKCIYVWLRPDILSHDGLILEAKDVIVALEQLVNTDGPVKRLFQQVTKISFDDIKQAICIELVQENPLFIYCLATANASIASRRHKAFSHQRSVAIGTGPFKLEYWEEDKIVMKKHHHYFAKKALLDQITLSHQGGNLDKHLSYNQGIDDNESYTIQAFSYLAHNRRPICSISDQTWQQLFTFIESRRFEFAANSDLDVMEMLEASTSTSDVPKLTGTIVLAHPKWTIKYLEKMSEWLVGLIQQTGLQVKFVELSDASKPQLVKEYADLLIIEDLIESPFEYGAYEWLLTGTGIRFVFNPSDFDQHFDAVHDAISKGEPLRQLVEVLAKLRHSASILPLFWGQEQVTCQKGVSGIQIRKSGYSDFYKLRITPSN